ncbi:HAD family hydrolase [Microbispora siamensis]
MLPELHPGDMDALLFDWDGTLVDTQRANYRAMAEALAVEGVRLEQEWFDARTGLSSAEMIRLLARERELDLRRPVEEIVADRDERFLRTAHEIRMHTEVEAVVSAFHRRLPMAVASGGARRVIETTLRHLPIRHRFTTLVTRDDVEKGKPAPDIFLRAADVLGVSPARCTVYEDSDEGMAAACAAGMAVIDVRPFTRRHGGWGPRCHSRPPT